jgi:hypothetical protein
MNVGILPGEYLVQVLVVILHTCKLIGYLGGKYQQVLVQVPGSLIKKKLRRDPTKYPIYFLTFWDTISIS